MYDSTAGFVLNVPFIDPGQQELRAASFLIAPSYQPHIPAYNSNDEFLSVVSQLSGRACGGCVAQHLIKIPAAAAANLTVCVS